MLFPSELWIKIKSYEYQLFLKDKIINDIIFHAYMPYYLSMHNYQSPEQLYNYILTNTSLWRHFFDNKSLFALCDKYDKEAKSNS